MIRIHLFKEKGKERGEQRSQLSGQWKVPMFGGQWKVPMERKEETPFHLFPLSPQEILLKPSFFPLILKFYFTTILGHYLRISFLFLDL